MKTEKQRLRRKKRQAAARRQHGPGGYSIPGVGSAEMSPAVARAYGSKFFTTASTSQPVGGTGV